MTSDNPSAQVLGANVTITPRICGGCTWTATLPGDDTVFLDGIIYDSVADAQQGAYRYFQSMFARTAIESIFHSAYHDRAVITFDEYNSVMSSVDDALSDLSQMG